MNEQLTDLRWKRSGCLAKATETPLWVSIIGDAHTARINFNSSSTYDHTMATKQPIINSQELKEILSRLRQLTNWDLLTDN